MGYRSSLTVGILGLIPFVVIFICCLITPADQEVYDFDSIMKSSSNSLQDAAVKLCPDIKIIIDELSSTDGSLYSRMTGSGSCCFTVFNEKDLAQDALNILKSNHSDWWFHLSRII